MAGIVTTILSGDGRISVSQERLLSLAAQYLDRLRPQLDGEAATYFDELRGVVTLALAGPLR